MKTIKQLLRKSWFTLCILLAFSALSDAQVSISQTNSTPDPSSMLDVQSSSSGILVPRMTQTNKNGITSPAQGLLIYQTDQDSGFYYYEGSLWKKIGSSATSLDEAYDNGRTINADMGPVLLQGNDGFQVTGNYNSGNALTLSGAGTRMFFYPKKAAFRLGTVTGTQWDDSNIGDFSMAIGLNSIASDIYTMSFGANAEAINSNAISLGNYTKASGVSSLALGVRTTAVSGYETAMGRYNTAYTPNSSTTWNVNDRLFVIGNGTSSTNTSDAVVILKNGKLGFGMEAEYRLNILNDDLSEVGVYQDFNYTGNDSMYASLTDVDIDRSGGTEPMFGHFVSLETTTGTNGYTYGTYNQIVSKGTSSTANYAYGFRNSVTRTGGVGNAFGSFNYVVKDGSSTGSTFNDAYGTYNQGRNTSGNGNAYGVYGYAFCNNSSTVAYGGIFDYYVLGWASGLSAYFDGNTYCTATYTGSDEKLKKNITGIDSALSTIMKLEPKEYEFKTETYRSMNLQTGTHAGLIAQDLEKVLPATVQTVVHPAATEEEIELRNLTEEEAKEVEFKSVNYTELIPYLIKAIQEQQAVIEAQQAEIDILKDKVE